MANRQGFLTRRQSELVRLILEGKTLEECAEALVLSKHTIWGMRENIRRRLGVKNDMQIGYAVAFHELEARDAAEG